MYACCLASGRPDKANKIEVHYLIETVRIRIWFRIEVKCLIRIRIKNGLDPQHWPNRNYRTRNYIFINISPFFCSPSFFLSLKTFFPPTPFYLSSLNFHNSFSFLPPLFPPVLTFNFFPSSCSPLLPGLMF
jgi:hypothetical protein